MQKIKVEAIDLSLSVVAFDNDKLVGFILQGIDDIAGKRTAYNAGTGVLSASHGAKITSFMYEYAAELTALLWHMVRLSGKRVFVTLLIIPPANQTAF